VKPLLIVVVVMAAGVLFIRSTCAISNMTRRTAHVMRLAAFLMSVSSLSVILSLYAGSWLREYGVAGIVIAAAIRTIFGRRPVDRFFGGDGA
jgi:hypothetical protein